MKALSKNKMINRPFQSLLKQAVVLPVGFMAILAMLLLWQFRKLNEEGKWVHHTDEVIDQIHHIQTSLLDMETGMRGFVHGGQLEFLEPYKIAKPKLSPALFNLEKMTQEKPQQTSRVLALRREIETWISYTENQISLRRKTATTQKPRFLEDRLGKFLMDHLRNKISQILFEERTLQMKREEEFKSTQKEIIFLIVSISLLFAIFLGYFARRQLRSLSYIYETAIKQRQIAEESLVEKINDLQTERKVREIFVSTLTHDLRTPIMSIQMSAQLILRHPNGTHETTEKNATRILKSSHQVSRMIENLLDANRIKAGERLSLNVIALDFLGTVKETVENLILIHGPRFMITNSPSDFRGYWSADGIRRILENLCNNAVKYGAENTQITIKVVEQFGKVEFSVHNQGIALSSEEQIKLFEPFQRSRSVQESGEQGWGLGLTLVQGIVEAHGGTVRVESSETSGTTFIVNLPYDARSRSVVEANLKETYSQKT
jgi:signal transduction histidine kinase